MTAVLMRLMVMLHQYWCLRQQHAHTSDSSATQEQNTHTLLLQQKTEDER
jgi:hypothetical protein